MPAQHITKEEYCYWVIKSAMDKKRLNQTKLAQKLGVTQGAVSSYVRNIYNATPTKILMMSDILGIEIFSIMAKYWREEKC